MSSSKSSDKNLKRKREVGEGDASDQESASGIDSDSPVDEGPVLSHAAQRKETKKRKLQATEPSAKKDSDDKKQRQTRQNSVWVGNLSFKTTANALEGFFEGVGKITRIHMPTKVSTDKVSSSKGENKGFAYVDFDTPDAKVVAISLSEKNLDGRKLLIKDGDTFEGRPLPAGGQPPVAGAGAPGTGLSKTARKILSSQKHPPATTLFLGNLPFETTEKSLRDFFEAHRSKFKEKQAHSASKDAEEEKGAEETGVGIRKVRLGTFEDSGACKGFAFLDFTDIQRATTALTNPKNHTMDGRKLVVEFASADAVRRGGGGPKRDRDDKHENARGQSGKMRGTPRSRPANVEEHQGGAAKAIDVEPVPPSTVTNQGEEWPAGYSRRGRGGRDTRSRPKPGAALALAQREKIAIVPSEGQRLKFT